MLARIPWKHFPNIFSAAVIALMIGLYIYPFGDLDFGMLIRLGEHIISTGQLRPPEGFSYTIYGQEVPDHEWLFELIIWSVWSLFGYGGLKLFKVLLVGSTLCVLGWRLHSAGVRWHGILLAIIVAVLVVAPAWNLRPLYFTTLGLLLVSWWLHDHCTGVRPLTWWLPVYLWFWANVHPGVITGQALILGAIAWEWANRSIKLNRPLDLEACKRLTLIGGIGLVATLIGPDPLGRLAAPFHAEVRHPVMRIFVEMQPLHVAAFEQIDLLGIPYSGPNQLAITYLVAGVVFLTVVLRFRDFRLWEVALLAGVFGLASLAIRSVQDCVLVSLAVGVPHMPGLLRDLANDRRRWWAAVLLRTDRYFKRMLQSPPLRFQALWPVLALAILAVVSLIPPLGRNMPLQARDIDPVMAVNWLEANPLPGERPWKIFSHPNHGAYLVWRLGPDNVRCYVDTRGFIYPPQLIEDGLFMSTMAEGWREQMDRILESGTEFFFLDADRTYTTSNLWVWLSQRGARPLYVDPQVAIVPACEVRRCLNEPLLSQPSEGS